MRFDPQSEEQLQTSMLLPKGDYPYRVIKSEDKISAAGNEYIALILKVYDHEGKEHAVFTNLALVKLIKHFCDVNGLEELYKSGNIEAYQLSGKCGGLVSLDIEPEKPNPRGGMYRPKNVVLDYIQGAMQQVKSEKGVDFEDSDIPF